MTNLYLKDRDGVLVPTAAGYERLEELVSDARGNVYIMTGMSPMMAAAGMARLSRNPNDMRAVILGEFASKDGADQELLQRVITGYGDDSVQQLVGIQGVFEGISNLMTKQVEWSRLGAYLEQSTRYIPFDQKVDGRYKYHIPNGLGSFQGQYEEIMDMIFDDYSVMVAGVTEYVRKQQPLESGAPAGPWNMSTRAKALDAVRPVLPVATTATVGFFASAQTVDNLIMHLMSQDLPEAVQLGESLLREARKSIGAFLERTDLPERGLAAVAHRANIRRDTWEFVENTLKTKESHIHDGVTVDLVSHWPDNENEVLARALFAHSARSLTDLREDVARMSSSERAALLKASLGNSLNRRHKPGRAFEMPHYEIEVVGDYGTFRDLQRHRMVDAFEWQE